jgi:hypothetical protein
MSPAVTCFAERDMPGRSSWTRNLVAVVGGLALACGGSESDTEADQPRVSAEVVDALAAGQSRSLIVELDEAALSDQSPETFRSSRALSLASEHQAFADARAAVYESAKSQVLANVASAELELKHRYSHLPAMHVEVRSLAALQQLLARTEVLRIHEESARTILVDSNLALINQPAAVAAGKIGQGTTVAVLDTGADYRVADLGSCTAPGVPASTCRVAYAADIAANDGALDDNGHGTNVSSIVAKVAPGAKIAALDVFRGQYAYDSDLLTAINWAIQNRAAYNIVAISMSLGGGSSTSPCKTDPLASAIAAARSAGILSAIASGNDGAINAISSPACVPGAISVGAVYAASYGGLRYSNCTDITTAADKITCFSNSASFLSLLAPGAMITAGGYTMAGTSQATPHVAGAIAVLRAAFPSDTPDQTLARLQSTGTLITDARNGLTAPRINLSAALGASAPACAFQLDTTALSFTNSASSQGVHVTAAAGCRWSSSVSSGASWLSATAGGTGSATVILTAQVNTGAARSATVTVGGVNLAVRQAGDMTAPVGSISVNGGQRWTSKTAVTLALSATDASGVAGVCLSNGATCTAWTTYATAKSWTLASTQGSQTVRAWFKDPAGNVSAPASATIALDQTAPVNGTVTAVAAKTSVALSWSGFSDALSGVVSYTLVYASSGAPASCAVGTRLYAGTATSFTHSGLGANGPYNYRLCATDGAGNVSAGVVKAVKTLAR